MFTYLQGGLIATAQQRGRNLAQAGPRTDGIKPRFCSRSGKQERKLGIFRDMIGTGSCCGVSLTESVGIV